MQRLKQAAGAARRVFLSDGFQWVLVGLGVSLRLAAYLHNRSLWRDEALLASNIEGRSYAALLEPLDNQQAAPAGFLMLERFAVQIFGESEYALRLIPLAAGIASMFLLRSVARRSLAPAVVPFALGFFAISEKAIYYSSEVKQYSTDVAICLALLLAAIAVSRAEFRLTHAVWLGIAGAIALWISHPAVFILAASGTSLFVSYGWKKDWRSVWFVLLAGALWVASFVVSYVTILRDTVHSGFLLTFWDGYGAFMPASASVWSRAAWFVTAFRTALENPTGFHWGSLAAMTFVIGCASALYYRKYNLLMAAAAIPFVLLASALHKYPFLDRLLLFLVPTLLLLIAEGVDVATRRAMVLGVALGGVLLFHPVVNAAQNPTGNPGREDIKPALAHVRAGWRPGDTIYVHYAVKRLFKYYAPRYAFTEEDYFKGAKKPEDSAEFLEDVDQLRGRGRVWVLFLIRNDRTAQELESFLDLAPKIGSRVDTFEAPGISVFLYDPAR